MRFVRATICITMLAATTLGCSVDQSDTSSMNFGEEALLRMLPPAARTALEGIKKSKFYHQPTYQDCVVAATYTPDFPFILSPRRQTDGLTRQLYWSLPLESRMQWAYVIPDRIIQNPERHLSYLMQPGRRKGYIIGTVAGTSNVERCKTDEKELLYHTYKLLRGIGYPADQIRVLFSKGDSPTDTASEALDSRTAASVALNGAIAQAESEISRGVTPMNRFSVGRPAAPIRPTKPPQVRLTWGADELVMLAFANVLMPMTVSVTASNPDAPQHYEAGQSIADVVKEKAADADLTIVDDSANPDIKLVIHSGEADGTWDPFPKATNVAYVDRRATANGALDTNWAPIKRCNGLAYAAWGTAANSAGSALATAKILTVARNARMQRRLWLEAVAHDMFFIGYSERPELAAALNEIGITYLYNSYSRIPSSSVIPAFQTATNFVRENMLDFYASSGCMGSSSLQIKPQLQRFFEAQISVE